MIDLDELERLEKQASKGEWESGAIGRVTQDDAMLWIGDAMSGGIGDMNRWQDSDFVAAFRNAAPELLRLARIGQEAKAFIESSNGRACPCKHTTPCTPRCTCVMSASSRGCDRCCTYGSAKQCREKAEWFVAGWERAKRQREALETIARCDCLNPEPRGDLCSDLPWLKSVVEKALGEP